MAMLYRLAIDGDAIERTYWDSFIRHEFPAYEPFWIEYVVPLTNRPHDINFRRPTEITSIGKTDNDICIAQLHYTILIHFVRVYLLRSISDSEFTVQDLNSGLISLVSAQDLAFELLQRFTNPSAYDAWLPKQTQKGGSEGSLEATKAYKKSEKYPLQNIRDYRNSLAHGRMLPMLIGKLTQLPKIGLEMKYYDWRKVTDPDNNPGFAENDFDGLKNILIQAWTETRDYVNEKWQEVLLKNPSVIPVYQPPAAKVATSTILFYSQQPNTGLGRATNLPPPSGSAPNPGSASGTTRTSIIQASNYGTDQTISGMNNPA